MIEIHIEKKRNWEADMYVAKVSSNIDGTTHIAKKSEQDLDSRIVDVVAELLHKGE